MLSDGLFTAARRRLDNVWYFWQMLKLFQLAAARRRLADKPATSCIAFSFQLTAARRRLGIADFPFSTADKVSTHSRPKAAGRRVDNRKVLTKVSTHSRPKAAGCRQLFTRRPPVVSTHSRPKAAVHRHRHLCIHRAAFQLTAARRRLGTT